MNFTTAHIPVDRTPSCVSYFMEGGGRFLPLEVVRRSPLQRQVDPPPPTPRPHHTDEPPRPQPAQRPRRGCHRILRHVFPDRRPRPCSRPGRSWCPGDAALHAGPSRPASPCRCRRSSRRSRRRGPLRPELPPSSPRARKTRSFALLRGQRDHSSNHLPRSFRRCFGITPPPPHDQGALFFRSFLLQSRPARSLGAY